MFKISSAFYQNSEFGYVYVYNVSNDYTTKRDLLTWSLSPLLLLPLRLGHELRKIRMKKTGKNETTNCVLYFIAHLNRKKATHFECRTTHDTSYNTIQTKEEKRSITCHRNRYLNLRYNLLSYTLSILYYVHGMSYITYYGNKQIFLCLHNIQLRNMRKGLFDRDSRTGDKMRKWKENR